MTMFVFAGDTNVMSRRMLQLLTAVATCAFVRGTTIELEQLVTQLLLTMGTTFGTGDVDRLIFAVQTRRPLRNFALGSLFAYASWS